MKNKTRYLGMDVDKENIDIAVFQDQLPDPISVKRIRNEIKQIHEELIRQSRDGYTLRMCYEAGPCGFELKRSIEKMGFDCIVVSPGLVPQKPSDKVKTNRRDAIILGRMLRAGELQPIYVLSPERESVRDLVRLREDLRNDLLRCRHRLSKFLMRHGKVYPGKAWTQRHTKWLNTLVWEYPALETTFDYYRHALLSVQERQGRCDTKIIELSGQPPWQESIAHLRCFHGIDTLTAMAITAEIEDFRRFPKAHSFMGYLGLTPSECSSGNIRRQGSITKAGNTHVRRLLVEASWHYRHKPMVGERLRARRSGQPEWVIHLADRARERLHRKFYRMKCRGKSTAASIVAVARELAGFIWAMQVRLEAHSAEIQAVS